MIRVLIVLSLLLNFLVLSAEARLKRGGQSYHRSSSYGNEVTTAQGVANIMARIGRVGHFGGNRGYEGCGSGPTPHQAEMNCCYRRQMSPKEVGYAQAANGTWFCCCRY